MGFLLASFLIASEVGAFVGSISNGPGRGHFRYILTENTLLCFAFHRDPQLMLLNFTFLVSIELYFTFYFTFLSLLFFIFETSVLQSPSAPSEVTYTSIFYWPKAITRRTSELVVHLFDSFVKTCHLWAYLAGRGRQHEELNTFATENVLGPRPFIFDSVSHELR